MQETLSPREAVLQTAGRLQEGPPTRGAGGWHKWVVSTACTLRNAHPAASAADIEAGLLAMGAAPANADEQVEVREAARDAARKAYHNTFAPLSTVSTHLTPRSTGAAPLPTGPAPTEPAPLQPELPPKPKGPARLYDLKPWVPCERTAEYLAWFTERGIHPETVRAHGISLSRPMAYKGDTRLFLAFPFFAQGRHVNTHHRRDERREDGSRNRITRLDPNCPLAPYGIDEVQVDEVVWVEGQPDRMVVWQEYGPSVVSVANGSNDRLEWLDDEYVRAKLGGVKRHVFAGDMDEVGQNLMRELARRLGRHKAHFVRWPEGVHDANDALLKLGGDELRRLIRSAEPYPLSGVGPSAVRRAEMDRIRREGFPQGLTAGLGGDLDALWRMNRAEMGEFTVVTGAPGGGKTEIMTFLAVQDAKLHGRKSGIYSPESGTVAMYANKLVETYCQRDIIEVGESEFQNAADWVDDHMLILDDALHPQNRSYSPEEVFQWAEEAVQLRGIRNLFIDPWNRLAHTLLRGETIDAYLRRQHGRIISLMKIYGVNVYVGVHPHQLRKIEKGEREGEYPVVSTYDLAGGAEWFNAASNLLSMWRARAEAHRAWPVEMHVLKVKHRWNGDPTGGVVNLSYDTRRRIYIPYSTGTASPAVAAYGTARPPLPGVTATPPRLVPAAAPVGNYGGSDEDAPF